MKKNDIFTFIAPNEEEVTAIVIGVVNTGCASRTLVCYNQNRLFTMLEEDVPVDGEYYSYKTEHKFGEVLALYAELPYYDGVLEDYQHQIDRASDYADKTL